MVDSIVTRTLGMDFIYIDLLFIAIWVFFMIKKKYWIPLKFGIFGWGLYMLVDYYLWYIVMGSRTYDGPINDVVFFLWFTFSPGFVQLSYVFIMLEKRNKKEIIFWTILFFAGWALIGLFSQNIPIDDRIIRISRDMNEGNQRRIFTLMTLGGLTIGILCTLFKKMRVEDLIYIFIVGTLVELNLELSLSLSGIRLEQGTWSWELFIVNTLIEFNMGIMIGWFLWLGARYRRDRRFYAPLSLKDFKSIKTDYNLVSQLSLGKQYIKRQHHEQIKQYEPTVLAADLDYFNTKLKYELRE